MPLTEDEYQNLAARYLKLLARRDMAAWRQRVLGMIACDDEDDNPPPGFARLVGAMKRVHHTRRDDE
jgi:hypothetical protein